MGASVGRSLGEDGFTPAQSEQGRAGHPREPGGQLGMPGAARTHSVQEASASGSSSLQAER